MGQQLSDWIAHDGKGVPVDGETLVQVQFRCDGHDRGIAERASPDRADGFRWTFAAKGNFSAADDIIAYRIIPGDAK